MEANHYQTLAADTCVGTSDNFSYLAFGLLAEAGEVADKIAKAVRGGEISVEDDDVFLSHPEPDPVTEEFRHGIAAELGDVLWFVANLAYYLGFRLDDIMADNLRKIEDRQRRGVIVGDGDNR